MKRILAAGFLVASSHTLLLAALPLHLQSMGVPAATLGMVVGAYAVAAGAFRLLGGGVVDRIAPRRGLRAASACSAAGFALLAALPAGPLLVLPRLLHGVGLAWFYTTALAWIANETAVEARGRSMGLFASTTGIAFVTMPSVGLVLLDRFGASVLFLLCAAGAAGVGVLAVDGKSAAPAGATAPVRAPIALPLAVAFLASSTLGSLEAFLPMIAAEREVERLVPVFVGFGFALAAGRFGGGALCDRIGPVPVGAAALVLVAAALALVSIASGTAEFALVAALYGLSIGAATTSMLVLVSRRTPAEAQGRALAVASLATDIGTAAGAALAGLLAARAPLVAIPRGTAVAALFAAAILVLGSRRGDAGAPGGARRVVD
jgi:MFS family permease